MAPYLQTFLSELGRRGHDVSQWSYSDGERPTLTLPAKSPQVGPLVLFDEEEELTLEIGYTYHCHFDGLATGEYDTNRMHAAAMLAADFVDRILLERIGVAVHYNERGCIGAALIYLDDHGLTPESLHESDAGIAAGKFRTERFLWSGRVGNPT
jgi:hypothetical protein